MRVAGGPALTNGLPPRGTFRDVWPVTPTDPSPGNTRRLAEQGRHAPPIARASAVALGAGRLELVVQMASDFAVGSRDEEVDRSDDGDDEDDE